MYTLDVWDDPRPFRILRDSDGHMMFSFLPRDEKLAHEVFMNLHTGATLSPEDNDDLADSA